MSSLLDERALQQRRWGLSCKGHFEQIPLSKLVNTIVMIHNHVYFIIFMLTTDNRRILQGCRNHWRGHVYPLVWDVCWDMHHMTRKVSWQCEETGQWMAWWKCYIYHINLDFTTTYTLLLLMAMICPRGKGKNKIPILNTFEITTYTLDLLILCHNYLQGKSICIEKALSEVDLQAPFFIATFGIETNVYKASDRWKYHTYAIALHCCFAATTYPIR